MPYFDGLPYLITREDIEENSRLIVYRWWSAHLYYM